MRHAISVYNVCCCSRVKLFEARPRLGGRAHTVTHDDGVLELGAQWLHGACHANPLVNLAARHGLLGPRLRVLEEAEDRHFYTGDGRIVGDKVASLRQEKYAVKAPSTPLTVVLGYEWRVR